MGEWQRQKQILSQFEENTREKWGVGGGFCFMKGKIQCKRRFYMAGLKGVDTGEVKIMKKPIK